MIFFKAQRMQQLAQMLMELQRRLEAEGGDASHIRQGLDEVARRVGVDLEIVRLASPETVLQVLTPGGGGDPGKIWAVGELLYLEGLRALAEDEPSVAVDALRKASRLLEALPEDLALPDEARPPAERLDRIGKLLEGSG